MRAARLERHQERLPGGVHHRVGDEEALLVDPVQDFEADADPGFGSRAAPAGRGLPDRREQRVEVGLRVRDAERETVRRALAADRADGARLVQRERLVAQRVEGGLAGLGGALAVDLGARRFGIRAPVAALGDGDERALERGAVAFEQRVGHGQTPIEMVSNARVESLTLTLSRQAGEGMRSGQAVWS